MIDAVNTSASSSLATVALATSALGAGGGALATKVRFNASRRDFHAAVKERVEAHFAERKLFRGANAAMYAKSAFWAGCVVFFYALILSNQFSAWPSLAFAMLLGFSFAGIGFNIGHDAIHGAYSDKNWVNGTLSWAFDLIGASSYTWAIAHNFVHHTYTNIPGHDGDIEPGEVMRFHTQHDIKPIYRFQHLYGPFLYTFTSLIWVFLKDFVQMAKPDPRTGKFAPVSEYVKLGVSKLLHVLLLIVVPALVVELPLWQLAIGYVIMHMVAGFVLALVFQLAHVVESVAFPLAPPDGLMSDAWAEHQMHTTANFGRGSFWCQFICGGLNHQVEHHLFPRISHIHYPAIAEIVRTTALEHGLPYHESPTFMAAVGSHLRTLKRMATEPRRSIEEAPARAMAA